MDEKKISSLELTKYFLARIKSVNKELNAFITISEEEALKQAKDADDFINSPGENPFLCGIPYAAKDLFCTKGVRTTAASKILDNYIPPFDSTVIKKIRDQKSVLLGKTNLDQFAHGSSGETSAFGPTKNPWDKTRMPGGSSSGSAAAVAAGLTPWAAATETGGSIRYPSSLCGITGWKPTYGRVSRYGVIAMGSSLDSPGAMAYCVEDIARLAEILAGQDEKDSTTGRVEVPAYSKNLSPNLKGVKIGIAEEYFLEGMNEDLKKRVEDALKQLENLGVKLVKVHVPVSAKFGSLVYAIVALSEISSNLARYDGIRYGHTANGTAKDLMEVYTRSRAEGFGDEAKRRIMTGTYVLSAGYYDAYYKKAQKVRRLIINEFADTFKNIDVLAAPTGPGVAQKLGHAADDPLFGYIVDQLNIPSSLAGLPALSVPCGFARPTDGDPFDSAQGRPERQSRDETPSMDGLPVGLQLIGPQWGEQKIFNVGYAYQQVTDWHRKHPNLA